MAYKLLNQIFYPDITNIIINYLLPDENKVKRGFKINLAYMDGVFTMMVPDLKHSSLIQHLNMLKSFKICQRNLVKSGLANKKPQ